MVRDLPKVTQIVRGRAQIPIQMWLRCDFCVPAEHRVIQSRVLLARGDRSSLSEEVS